MKRFSPLLAVLLSACAGSPLHVATMSPERLATAKPETLCNAVAQSKTQSARDELQRRAVISPDEWALIDQRVIKIGMSELGLICSWGYPGLDGRVNESVGRWGVHKQWVYRSCRSCRANYVYTQNGKVTSWQD